ncbi:hypothetical protein E1301_Tti023431 [Triplophysa tibetana]|uniref:Uncharacterized protein n=1 Tax=Triplophysa tibetana TaxID=1572043 RepID=A0A5A9NGW3_9TELE|nr:hypothetical protein E1301_Tti023431 [Triplophysa tibetana]
MLLNNRVNLNARDIKERQSIHLAAHLGHLEVVKLLLSCSADISCRDKQGFTPIHVAALSGHIEVVKCLLRHGAEIDEVDVLGNTALHMACYTCQRRVASELIYYGAGVNQTNVRGCTPLHLSAMATDGAECLELLLNNGADINVQVNSHHGQGVRLVSEAPSGAVALGKNTALLLESMLRRPHPAVWENKEGKSPLHMAAIRGCCTRSELLIQNGARQKYHGYLEEQKKKRKRKALTDDLEDLKKKRARMEADICALQKSADEYAEKAESSNNLTFITKSNSFRRTAKEKKTSLQKIGKQIDEKLAEMKE